MILPKDDRCIEVLKELDGDPSLTAWELNFIKSNRDRTKFTDAQKEVIAKLDDKYEI